MMKRLFIVGILLYCFCFLQAQEQGRSGSAGGREFFSSEPERSEDRFQRMTATSVASEWFDVTYYKLDLAIAVNPPAIHGCAFVSGICRQNSDTILVLDLTDAMVVDSVLVNDISHRYHQDSSSVTIELDSLCSPGAQRSVTIYYGGLPRSTGFGSFMFGSHDGTPWVWSLSEPYGARDWFPCKDHPSDKADSADIIITCDSQFRVGSNGALRSVKDNGNGTTTHHWEERYPVATYLLSVAITNYAQFSNWFHYSQDDSMEVLNYVLPEHLPSALENLPRTIEMLEIFSNLFGLYPFIKEKYGHADIGTGGAMEHQTMTSTTTYDERTIAHELAHQWFGNMITCRTWSDLWLNEGFAQYSTALYLEKKYGSESYREYMRNQLANARHAEGSLFVRDTSDVKNLFNGNRVYAKGASVLHMLRRVVGDSVFFRLFYDYANHHSVRYSAASTYDFQSVCERTSGKDLDYFFSEWVYGEGYPHYSVQWNVQSAPEGYLATIVIDQIQEGIFFRMPVDVQIIGDDWDTTITVVNGIRSQKFLVNVRDQVKSVQIDPRGWILKDVREDIDQSFSLDQNTPNPFSTKTKIMYHLSTRGSINISVFNTLGQQVTVLIDKVQPPGSFELEWNDASSSPSGIYFYRLRTATWTITRKMLLIR